MSNSDGPITRRGFQNALLGSLAFAGPWTSRWGSARVLGANDRIGLSVIGCGSRGRYVAGNLEKAGGEVRALCDPDPSQVDAARNHLGRSIDALADFRKLLERPDCDAVLVATPDHWHALPVIHALRSGKDVYIEKPLSYSVAEGRAMVDAAQKSGRVAMIGTQQRSGAHFAEAVERVHKGELGKVARARFWNVWNGAKPGPGGGRAEYLGNPPDSEPPTGVDYDLWLGPAPIRPFNRNRFHWNYVYFWDYAGGMMSGWGIHHTDVIHWALRADAPLKVASIGGKFVLDDARETPDTIDTLFEYPGCTVQGSIYHANARPIEGAWYGVAFYGSDATMRLNREGYEIWPEGDPRGATSYPAAPIEEPHAQAFIEAVRSRRVPHADLATGHRSTVPVLLANISYRIGRSLRWDPEHERCIDDPAANALLSREYRAPWTLA
jgi:predicted dehydrogenase